MTPAPDRVQDEDGLVVVCASAELSVVVPPGTSILEAVRGAGLAVPAACPDGRCGACETRVLDGQPLHRDRVLTEEERDFGETMMLCVSGATTPCLVLDL